MPNPGHPDNQMSPRPWSPRELWVLGLTVLVGLLLGSASRGLAFPVGGDMAIYETLGRSISTGHFRDEYLIGVPPHGKYPPGMPLFLALVRSVLGHSMDAVLFANLTLLSITAVLTGDAVRRLINPRLGLVASGILMVNPGLFALAEVPRPAMLYLTFCSISLWFALRDQEEARRWYPAFMFAAAIAAFLTRLNGIALFPAIGWVLLQQRRWRPLLLGVGVVSMVVVGWMAYARWTHNFELAPSYAYDLSLSLSPSGPLHLVERALWNIRVYFSQFATAQFGVPDLRGQTWDNLVGGLLLAIPLMIGAWTLRARWSAAIAFLLMGAAILAVFQWPERRFLAALLPWMVVAFLAGVQRLGENGRVRLADRMPTWIGLVLIACGLFGRIQEVREVRRCQASAPAEQLPCAPPDDRDFAAATRFIRDSLPANIVVASAKPAFVWLESGRRGMQTDSPLSPPGQFPLSPPGEAPLVILLSAMGSFDREQLAPRLRDHCSAVRLHSTISARTLVVSPRLSDAFPNACDALDEFLAHARDESPP